MTRSTQDSRQCRRRCTVLQDAFWLPDACTMYSHTGHGNLVVSAGVAVVWQWFGYRTSRNIKNYKLAKVPLRSFNASLFFPSQLAQAQKRAAMQSSAWAGAKAPIRKPNLICDCDVRFSDLASRQPGLARSIDAGHRISVFEVKCLNFRSSLCWRTALGIFEARTPEGLKCPKLNHASNND